MGGKRRLEVVMFVLLRLVKISTGLFWEAEKELNWGT